MISLQNRFSLLKERSSQEGRNSPIKSEDSLICLFFKNRYDINLNQYNVSDFINFDLICKSKLLESINNYFYMHLCEVINKDIDFIFNTNNMWEYFNFDMLSR